MPTQAPASGRWERGDVARNIVGTTTSREPTMDARRVNDFILQSLAHDARREAAVDLVVWGIVIVAAIVVADVVTMLHAHM
jgi:hypothetical protein